MSWHVSSHLLRAPCCQLEAVRSSQAAGRSAVDPNANAPSVTMSSYEEDTLSFGSSSRSDTRSPAARYAKQPNASWSDILSRASLPLWAEHTTIFHVPASTPRNISARNCDVWWLLTCCLSAQRPLLLNKARIPHQVQAQPSSQARSAHGAAPQPQQRAQR